MSNNQLKPVNQQNNIQRVNSNNYRQIFLSNTAMIDLRSPLEFSQGAFPHAVNLPLMNDDERKQVGICYKQHGQIAAIELGHQLVQGKGKARRLKEWLLFANKQENTGFLYCFRGGLRSKISQQWLVEAGAYLPLVEGGYKAMRKFLIEETERLINLNRIYIITGLTGSGKTRLIEKQHNAIDLEALAMHRGSSFGRRLCGQPSQINFENTLAIKLLKHERDNKPFLLLEDEGRLIGSRSIPLPVKNKMDQSPLILIEESFEQRVEQIFNDYVIEMLAEFEKKFNHQAVFKYQDYLILSVEKIKKRLGGDALKTMLALINHAIEQQQKRHNLCQHKDWIVYLLENYYDPMYRFQMAKKKHRVQFSGCTTEVEEYIGSLKG